MFLRFRILCIRHFVINVINNIRTHFIISFYVICVVIYCSFCCIYVWLDHGTYMIARFMSFYKPGVTIVSLAAPTHAKKRNVPLMIRGFATPTHLAHTHMQRKETYFAPAIPKHCANRSCHLVPRFLHTSRVCNLAFLFTCVGMVPSSVSICIRRRSPRQPYAIMPLLQQLQDIHSYMLLVCTLRYMPR